MSNFGKLCALLFSACLVLGGTSFAGHLGDTVLQIASICLMAVILARPAASLPQEGPRPSRMPFAIMLLMAAVPLSQLIPLPPEWLAGIPNFKIVREAHSTAGFTQVWLPLSVSPHATWISLLSLLPLFAIFWSTLHLANRDRRAISLILLAAGVLSAFLGLLQLAQGPHSPLRFFAVTNTTEAV
ncbi:MAG: O-antigen ligase family protein, partial [Hyphomicrobium sp.]